MACHWFYPSSPAPPLALANHESFTSLSFGMSVGLGCRGLVLKLWLCSSPGSPLPQHVQFEESLITSQRLSFLL
jgi:hypothetical protein